MKKNLDDFCRKLLRDLDDEPYEDGLDSESIAWEFVRFFGVSARPTMEELTEMLYAAGIGAVSGAFLPDGMRGFHCNSPEGGYDIHYLEGQGRSANEHTVLHETYEIIHETLCLLRFGFPPDRKACRQADRFAAAVLMQPEGFAALAEAAGFDVIALKREYGRALASVALRLSEVMRDQPLLAVLYQRGEREGPLFRTTAPVAYFRALVVARTPGFGARKSRDLNGTRGGTLRWGRPDSSRVAGRASGAHRKGHIRRGRAGSGGRGHSRKARLLARTTDEDRHRRRAVPGPVHPRNPTPRPILQLPARFDCGGGSLVVEGRLPHEV